MGVLGLIVNPVAGIGGRFALKGSDDGDAVTAALARGAEAVAPLRARRALAVAAGLSAGLEVLAPAGVMGADLADELGLAVDRLAYPPADPTTAADTRATAAELAVRGVDLILFAGGDGTARDIVSTVERDVPVLGVPAGVKMRSAVFATSPERAGEAVARYLTSPGRFELVDAEVLDAPDAALESELFAVAHVPAVGDRLQRGKATARGSDDAALAALCEELAREMEPGRLYLLGPGTTTARIAAALGVPSTLLGVDAIRDGVLVAADLDERGLLELLGDDGAATLVLGVIGGQGFLLGRGNQQLSTEVVRRIGAENVVVLAGAGKVESLDPPVLHVDLGDAESDDVLPEYLRVLTAPQRSIVLRVVTQ